MAMAIPSSDLSRLKKVRPRHGTTLSKEKPLDPNEEVGILTSQSYRLRSIEPAVSQVVDFQTDDRGAPIESSIQS